MTLPVVRAFVPGLLGVLCFSAASHGEVITLRSGQVSGFPGTPGQLDSHMTWGGSVGNGPLSGAAFTAADFNNTVANSAVVIAPVSVWIPGLTFDPQARWVATDLIPGTTLGASASTLYRVPFAVTTTGITSATLTIAWSSDDSLGDVAFGGPNPIGAYLRDPSGAVTPLLPVSGGNFTIESLVSGLNILGAVNTGVNELFLYQRDQGFGVSGVIFSAEISVIPAPGAVALLGLGGLIGARRRR